jgi:hypothetical protein
MHTAPGPDDRAGVRGAAVDLAALLPSWALHLRAERKSPETVEEASGDTRLLPCELIGTVVAAVGHR